VKQILVALLCLLAAACGTSSPATGPTTPPSSNSAAADEAPAVRAAFETYKKAALAKDGATGVSVLASPILGLYEESRKLALTASEQELSGLQLYKQVTVYMLRGEIDAATLRTATPKDLVKTALDKGLVGEQSITNLSLGEVAVNGDTASAAVLSGGKPAPFKFRFVREDGTWKIDLQPLLELTEPALQEVAKQKNLTPGQLIDQMLAAKYGPAKAAQLRKPVGA
jgi:hypothetical protein